MTGFAKTWHVARVHKSGSTEFTQVDVGHVILTLKLSCDFLFISMTLYIILIIHVQYSSKTSEGVTLSKMAFKSVDKFDVVSPLVVKA